MREEIAVASVALRNIVKRFGVHPVLHGINLEIPDGAFVVLLGPSGCGKSTLLRMIAGLEEISGGDVLIGGEVVNGRRPRDRNIAMVFQNYSLYAHMSVFENMAFSMRLRHCAKDEIERKVRWAASILGMESYLGRYPRQLSGGQRQRVAMGRALVRDPEVFLFDEPLSNLDAQLRVAMRTEIKALHQRLGTTSIYVTHDQIEAMTMADQIVVMRDGKVEQLGAPMDIYERPANIFVASFVGAPAMNLLRGRIEGDDGGPVFAAEGGGRWPLPREVAARRGQSVVYGIRPEDLALSSEAESTEATISLLETTGPELHIYAQAGGAAICGIIRERLDAKPGQVIRLRPQIDRIHLFDAATGGAL